MAEEPAADRAQMLEASIDRAFASGDNQGVLLALRQLASLLSTDAEVHHRLAVIEEQIGDPVGAIHAHLKCLQLAPGNPLAYLYAGYCLQQQGRTNAALAVYSLGSDLDAGMLQANTRGDPTGLRLNAANRALRVHFSALHREVVDDKPELARIHDAIWTRTHDRPYEFKQPQQAPHLFYIPALTPFPYAELESWPWVAELERQAGAIREELLANLSQSRELGRPYLDDTMQLGEEFKPLLGSLNWTALDLYKEGVRQEAMAVYFPRTLEALNCAPLYGLSEQPFEVFFSLLKPGHHIKPHYGLSNHSLTVHLPIITPPNCSLIVDREERHWQPGKLIAFDDSFLHEAINGSDEERVVLIFSIWHPQLSAAEREAITRSFSTRSQWLDERTLPTT